MKNLNKVLKVINEIQDDITLIKTEKKTTQINDGTWNNKEEIEYTVVLKFKDK